MGLLQWVKSTLFNIETEEPVMKYALIKAGVVINIIVASQSFIDQYMASQYDACIDVTNIYCGPGFLYDGTNFTDPNPSDVNGQ